MRRWNWERVISVVLLMPSAIAIAVFVYGFIGWTGYVSLTRWKGAQPDFTFAGLQNYSRLLLGAGVDGLRFRIDLRNTIAFTILFLAVSLVIGFLLAVLLDQRIRGEGFFRSVFLFPMAISFIVTGVVWKWLLTPGNPQLGSVGVNALLDTFGLDFLKSPWFTDATVWHIRPESSLGQLLTRVGLGGLANPTIGMSVAIISVVIAATWQMSGYTMALYLAGLRSIPDELREAARVDGASEFQLYRHILIPLLQPITLSAVIILGHISLKIYDLIVAMTGPGIGFATDVPAYNMWETTFEAGRFAQGSAISMVILILVAVLIVPYLVYSMRTEAEV